MYMRYNFAIYAIVVHNKRRRCTMRRKVLSIFLSLAMLCGLCVPPAYAANTSYSDTRGHWAEDAIDRWSDYGVIQGNNGRFEPDSPLTRAQMAVILSRLLALPEAKSAGFKDVHGEWFADAINRCAAAGIMLGDNGYATPNASITREQAVVMLGRALGFEPTDEFDFTGYTDVAQVSSYALGYVSAMAEAGIVKGTTDTTLSPKANITRAATVTILSRAIEVYVNEMGASAHAHGEGLVLVAADYVSITADEGTRIVVSASAEGTVVNGLLVPAGITYVAGAMVPSAPNPVVPGTSIPSYPNHPGNPDQPDRPDQPDEPEIPDVPDDTTLITTSCTISDGIYENVVISESVEDGEVLLENLVINGDLTIHGGGSNSVKLENCVVLGKIIMAKIGGEIPRLLLTNTPASAVEVLTNAIVEAADATSIVKELTVTGAVEVKGDNTSIETLVVPAETKGAVTITVTAGTVGIVKAAAEAAITGAANSVGLVVAENSVTVDSTVTNKVIIPETATGRVDVEITGNGTVDITVNSGNGVYITGDDTVVFDVTTDLEETPGDVNINGEYQAHLHVWNTTGVVTLEPTCEKDGILSYTCTANGCPDTSAAKTKTIPAIGHKFDAWKTVDSESHSRSCVNTGCTHTETAKHTSVKDRGTAATCTKEGLSDGAHCSACSAVLTEQTKIEPLGHDFANGSYKYDANGHWHICARRGCYETDEVAAHEFNTTNCAEKASCACGYTKLPGQHSWGPAVVTLEPTCDVKGEKTYTCTSCGETKTESIRVLGHVFAEWTMLDKESHTRSCTRDNCTYTETAQHTAVTNRGTAATCTEPGLSDGSHCSVCSGIIAEQTVIPALGHDFTGKYSYNANGHWHVCARTGCRVTDDVVAHTFDTTNCAEKANCACGYVKPAGEHAWGDGVVTTPATCEKDGVMTFTCISCGSTKTDGITALGHSWDEGTVTTPATCEEEGVMTFTCQNKDCGKTKTDVIDALGHSWDNGTVTTPATCEKDGVKTITCQNKNCGLTKTETIAATGHDWDEGTVTTPATCTTDGEKTATCQNKGCGKTDTVTIPALGHKWNEGTVTTPATCTTAGEKTATCQNKGCGLTDTVVIPALGHKWGEWTKADDAKHQRVCGNDASHVETGTHLWDAGVVTKQPTETTAGEKKFTCSICNGTKIQTIPATGSASAPELWFTQSGSSYFYLNWTAAELGSGEVYYINGVCTYSTTAQYSFNTLKDKIDLSQTTDIVIGKAVRGGSPVELYRFEDAIVVDSEALDSATITGQEDGRYLVETSIDETGYTYYMAFKNPAGEYIIQESTSNTGLFNMSPYEGCTVDIYLAGYSLSEDAKTLYVQRTNTVTVDTFTYCVAPTGVTEISDGSALQAALNKGGMVKLTADVEVMGSLWVPTGPAATLDLNGHTLTTSYVNISNGKELTIIGTTEGSAIITELSNSVNSGAILTMNGGSLNHIISSTDARALVLSDVTINAAYSSNAAIAANRCDEIILTNVTASNDAQSALNFNGCENITITGGSFTTNIADSQYYYAGTIAGCGTVTIDGAAFNGTGHALKVERTSALSMTDTTITATGNNSNADALYTYSVDEMELDGVTAAAGGYAAKISDGTNLTITNSEFTATGNNPTLDVARYDATTLDGVTVTGVRDCAKFNGDSVLIDEETEETAPVGTLTIKNSSFITTGTSTYNTLQIIDFETVELISVTSDNRTEYASPSYSLMLFRCDSVALKECDLPFGLYTGSACFEVEVIDSVILKTLSLYEDTTLTIVSGTFGFDPTDYLAEGSTISHTNNVESTWTVVGNP